MARRTVEVFDCDICGEGGERYVVSFPDDHTLALDRCPKHNKKLEGIRNEKGNWITNGSTRSTFKVSSLEEIQKQRQK
jgi:hypothetical protein